MKAPRLSRREIVLVGITALVCFAIAIPLTSASSGQAQRQFTVWPNNSARFANMDWTCFYTPRAAANDKQGNFQFWVPATVNCQRESTTAGIHVYVDGSSVEIQRCAREDAQGSPGRCTVLKRFARTP